MPFDEKGVIDVKRESVKDGERGWFVGVISWEGENVSYSLLHFNR